MAHTVWNSGDGPVRGLLIISAGDAEHAFLRRGPLTRRVARLRHGLPLSRDCESAPHVRTRARCGRAAGVSAGARTAAALEESWSPRRRTGASPDWPRSNRASTTDGCSGEDAPEAGCCGSRLAGLLSASLLELVRDASRGPGLAEWADAHLKMLRLDVGHQAFPAAGLLPGHLQCGGDQSAIWISRRAGYACCIACTRLARHFDVGRSRPLPSQTARSSARSLRPLVGSVSSGMLVGSSKAR
jgi:hypothetical protein